jgi:hypothetical protein
MLTSLGPKAIPHFIWYAMFSVVTGDVARVTRETLVRQSTTPRAGRGPIPYEMRALDVKF